MNITEIKIGQAFIYDDIPHLRIRDEDWDSLLKSLRLSDFKIEYLQGYETVTPFKFNWNIEMEPESAPTESQGKFDDNDE